MDRRRSGSYNPTNARKLGKSDYALGLLDKRQLLTVVQYRSSGPAPQASLCDVLSGAHPIPRVVVSEAGLGGNLLRWCTGTGYVSWGSFSSPGFVCKEKFAYMRMHNYEILM